MMLVVGIFGVLLALAVPGISQWGRDQRGRRAARSVADILLVARSEAMRTGENHVVFFGNPGQTDPSGNDVEYDGSWVPVLVINDGAPAASNCRIDAGEELDAVRPTEGMGWGVADAAGRVPTDGGAAAWNPGGGWDGATFADPNGNKVNWLMFRPDGVPVTFTGVVGGCGNVGSYGSAGGAFYVTTGERDFAVVLTPLGATRLHLWNQVGSGWTQ